MSGKIQVTGPEKLGGHDINTNFFGVVIHFRNKNGLTIGLIPGNNGNPRVPFFLPVLFQPLQKQGCMGRIKGIEPHCVAHWKKIRDAARKKPKYVIGQDLCP